MLKKLIDSCIDCAVAYLVYRIFTLAEAESDVLICATVIGTVLFAEFCTINIKSSEK